MRPPYLSYEFDVEPATPDIVRKFIGHGLTYAVPSKSTVEQIASRIRHREYRARRDRKRRMKAECFVTE